VTLSCYNSWEQISCPTLSVANVRLLLRAVMPLQRLSVKQATDLAIEDLLNRTRSRKSRLKKQHLAKELVAYHGLAQM